MDGGAQPSDLSGLAQFAAELGGLKRVRDASSPRSLAERFFRSAWQRLVGGDDPAETAYAVSGHVIAAIRLAGLTHDLMAELGVADPLLIMQNAYDEVCNPIRDPVRGLLRRSLGHSIERTDIVPGFVEQLTAQPRAGATCPGMPRLILQPPESHADHCLVVAVLGVVLAAQYGADPATVFIAGLAHHLHNATLPDSGFSGEVLLGAELDPLIKRLFASRIGELSAPLADHIRQALLAIEGIGTAEARAFHAADVLDRVLQMRHYESVARFRLADAMDTMELVHAGPVQSFHLAVLRQAGLS